VQTNCPSCAKLLRIQDDLLGKQVKCPGCQGTFLVPAESNGAAPPQNSGYRNDSPSQRPSSRRNDDYNDDPDDRPSRRSSRRRDDDFDDDYDDRPSRRRSRSGQRPGKLQAVAIMMLIGGIMSILVALTLMASTCFIWLPAIYGLVVGIMAIIKASSLLGSGPVNGPPPKGTAIMMIVNIINGDVVTMTLGIICLVFLGDQEVTDYFGRWN
jgi:hypothetical protein